VPLRAGTTKETLPERPITRKTRVPGIELGAQQPSRWWAAVLLCLMGALAAVAAGVYLVIAQPRTPESPLSPQATTHRAEKMTAAKAAVPRVTHARPVRLVIPKIGLDATIEYVGLTADNAMAAPSGPGKVGWYRFGPRPGNRGSAVIDGHSGYADGRPAAFDDLPELGKGDKLYVEDASGRMASFIVRKKKLYARAASPAEVFAPTASRRLNLITCTGSYDVAAGTHSQRLVVFAELQLPERLGRQQ
jgi:sortase (surface protein transpeptidase)